MKSRALPLGWLLGLPLFLCGRTAQAQGWNDFHFKKVFGEFGVGLELWDEKRQTSSLLIAQREVIPRAALTLGTMGYFYHPKLVEYDLRGTLRFEQQWVTIDGPQPDRSYRNIFPNLDMRARFFKDLAYSGEVYSQRAETWARQSFFPTIRSTTTETGLNFVAKDWLLPSNLHLHRYTFNSRGLSTQDEVRSVASLSGGTTTGKHSFNYFSEYNSIQLKYRNQYYDDYRLRANSKHMLDEESRTSWQNRFSFRKQVGDLNTGYTSASTGLSTEFTENLNGDTRLDFDDFSSDSSYTRTTRWRARLKHQLFKSLISRGNLRLQRTSVAGGDIGVNGFGGGLDYRKKTPIGQLGLRYDMQYYVQDQDDLQGQTPIFEESHDYVLGVPIIIENFSVDANSVRITDATGLTLYNEGLDYFLVPDGSTLQVQIPVGSLIMPGDTILISYSFQPSPAHTFSNTTHTSGFDINYGNLADLRVGYQTNDQALLSGTDPGNLTDTVTTTADFQVHPWASTLGAHYRRYESAFAPYERRALRFSVNKPIWTRSMWQVQAESYRTEFLNGSGNENGSNVKAFFTSSLWGTSVLEARVEWFNISYVVDKGDGYSLEFSWRRRIRDLEIALRLRYLDEQFVTATDQRIASLFFTLTRRF